MVSGGGKRMKDRGASERSVYPSSRLLVWHSRFDHARSRHADIVRGHALNQQIEVVLPTKAAVELAEALKWETSFFYEVTTSLALFLSPRFISEYVMVGAAYMIAKNVAIDSQNTAMLLPTGELLLLVDNETYEQLGLVGHKYAQHLPAEALGAKQHRTSRRGQRYVVSINLKDDEFVSGTLNATRDRVMHCLETKFEPLEMLLCAYNERGAPRTIIFDDDTIERTRVEVNGAFERLQDVVVPALDTLYSEAREASPRMGMEVLRSSLHGVHEWLGVVACRLTDLLQQTPLEEYVSTFQGIPDGVPTDEHSELSVVRWRGLIATEFAQRIIDRTRDDVKSGKLPWAAVTVWGFPDAIVSWQQEYEVKPSRWQLKKAGKQGAETHTRDVEVENREHGYLVNGANNYTFLVLPQQEYFAMQEAGPHDETM